MTASSSTDIYSQSGKKKNIRGKLIAVIAAAVVVCAGVCTVAGKQMYDNYQKQQQIDATLNTDKFYSGITVQGVDLGGMTMQQAQEAVKAKLASAAGNYDVKITYSGKGWEFTQKDMVFSYNNDSILKQAYAYGRSGDRETRYAQVTALKSKPKEYKVTATLNENDLKAKVDKIAAQVSRSPVNPTVVAFDGSTGSFTCKDGVEGLSVDTAKLWNDVKAIVDGSHTGTAEMSVKTVPFDKTIAEVKSHLQKLGTFSTTSTNNANGTYNMSKALLAVNGTSIPAGGTFSFLGTVGSCDQAHGYLEAGALLNGQHITEYGGGICQASTTIYGAALRSNMQITERYNHSMPSSYCTIGQDATVSYPGLDLKFKNTSDYPVYILTSASGRYLTATFYGYQSPDYDDIEIVSQTNQTYAAPSQAKYTEDSSLSAGTVELESRARTGYKVSARRVFYKNGKVVNTEFLNSSYYPPMPAYYSYGRGTNTAKLGISSSSSSASVSSKPSSSTPSKKPSASSSPSSKPSSQASSKPSSSSSQNNVPNDDVAA
ncbi:MAG TPA: VanW family protein [Caproicibacter sp.]|nr:VanW family protein [Caproicibacter sp.]